MASKAALGGETSSNTSSRTGFEKQLPDNCVEYLLFTIDAKQDSRKQLSRLEGIRKSVLQLSSSTAKEHIWQREEFNVETKNDQGKWHAP